MSAASSFRLDPSIAKLRGVKLRAKYDQATPEQRRALGFTRPATDAEIAAGQQEQSAGAPADFSGMVIPNPNHIQISADTDSVIPVTRLPRGVMFQKQNAEGPARMSIANPPRAQLIPPSIEEREQ